MSKSLLIALSIPLGLVVGSVLTMVIDRVPERWPVFRPGPRCPLCEAPIAPRHLVPVLSWFMLRGRCASCREPITVAYPIVEAVTAFAFVAAVLRIGPHWTVVPYWLFFSTLIAVSVVDLFNYVIPDRIVFPSLGASFALIVAISLYYDDASAITGALVGMLLYALMLGLPFVVRPNALGFGDVKLALLMGLFLGWFNTGDRLDTVRLVLIALVLGCFVGLVVGAGLFVARKISGRELLLDPMVESGEIEPQGGLFGVTFPFGPALAIGASIGVLFAPQLLY
jgi:leader peptidase (prepilin peptidase) / N-methyltransferase